MKVYLSIDTEHSVVIAFLANQLTLPTARIFQELDFNIIHEMNNYTNVIT